MISKDSAERSYVLSVTNDSNLWSQMMVIDWKHFVVGRNNLMNKFEWRERHLPYQVHYYSVRSLLYLIQIVIVVYNPYVCTRTLTLGKEVERKACTVLYFFLFGICPNARRRKQCLEHISMMLIEFCLLINLAPIKSKVEIVRSDWSVRVIMFWFHFAHPQSFWWVCNQ